MADGNVLARRVALVTGANKGIGLEIARGLAERGAAVLMGARDAAAGEAAAGSLRASGHDVEPIRIDVTDGASIRGGHFSDAGPVPW